jgi:hypothetical protein
LKKEREGAQKVVQRIDAALAALGGTSSNGSSRHTLSVAARRRISLAQKARWAKHGSQAEANDISSRTQADSGGAASKVGEGEEGQWR